MGASGGGAGGAGGDDDEVDSFELGRISDLYVAGDLGIPNPTIDIPDIFSNDSPAIDDTPEAVAAFDEFVDQLDNLPSSSAGPSIASAASVSQTTSAASVSVSHPLSSTTTSQTNTSASRLFPMPTTTSSTAAAQDYPDRLDLNTIAQHALPLNLNLPTHPNFNIASYNAPTYSPLLSDADALSAHIQLPFNTRSWIAGGAAIGPAPGANSSTPQFANIPRAHDVLMSRVGASAAGNSSTAVAHQTAAARGRPRVREMRHVPERTSALGIGAARAAVAVAVPVGATNSPQSNGSAKLRYSKGAAPSKYCHVCGRSAKTVSVALCGNNRLGLCRKVVCDKCLLMHQRDSWEMAKRADAGWICMHCRNQCPERARCHQYQRNNLKRRMRSTSAASGAATHAPFASTSSPSRQPANGRIFKQTRNPNRRSAPESTSPPGSAAISAQTTESALQQPPTASAVLGTTYTLANMVSAPDMVALRMDGVPGRNVSDVQMAPVAQMGAHFLRSFPETSGVKNNDAGAGAAGSLLAPNAFANPNVKVERGQVGAHGDIDANATTQDQPQTETVAQQVQTQAQEEMLGATGAPSTKPDDDTCGDAAADTTTSNVEK